MIHALVGQICCCMFLPCASPTWADFAALRTNDWFWETTLTKRTFQMFEPIEIAATLRYVGTRTPILDNGFVAAARREGTEVPALQWGIQQWSQPPGKEFRFGPDGIEKGLARLDTVLDMSRPGTYTVWLTRRAYTFPSQSHRARRELLFDSLTSRKYEIEILPPLAQRFLSPQPRPDLVMPEPTAAERKEEWQVVLAPKKVAYVQGEAIRIRMLARYLGSKPCNVRRVVKQYPRLKDFAVVRDEGMVPPRRLFATMAMYTTIRPPVEDKYTFSYADDVWNTGFTMDEEIVPNHSFDMTQPRYYRMWFSGSVYLGVNGIDSNTVRIRVKSPSATVVNATGQP